jgi:hypothetical protein
MAEINGRSPGELKPRVVQIKRIEGNRVSIWIHPPDSDDNSGWEAIVKIDELREALVAEGISE